jgi:hypothetical protein
MSGIGVQQSFLAEGEITLPYVEHLTVKGMKYEIKIERGYSEKFPLHYDAHNLTKWSGMSGPISPGESLVKVLNDCRAWVARDAEWH